MKTLMYHDDSCGEFLTDRGSCPKCGFTPDMQSTGFKDMSEEEYARRKARGETFLGLRRVPQ